MNKLYTKSGKLGIVKEAFHPKNSLLSLINIFIFILVMILWFWYVGSQQIYVTIDDKISQISNILDSDPDLKNIIDIYINDRKNNKEYIDNTIQKIKDRNNKNITYIYTYFLAPLLILLLVIIYLIYYIISHRYRWGLVEWILIVIMCSAFITEVIFYLVVILDFEYITNSEILLKLFS